MGNQIHFPVHCISKTNRRKYQDTNLSANTNIIMAITIMPKESFGVLEWWSKSMQKLLSIGQKGDASNIVEEQLHQEPVVTKTWYHTGAFLQKEKILDQFAKEYWYEEMNGRDLLCTS